MTVTARLGQRPAAAGRRSRFALRRGRIGRVRGPRHAGVRRALGDRRRLRGRVYVSSRDGQGLTRASVSPVRVVRGRLWRSRRGRRGAGDVTAAG